LLYSYIVVFIGTLILINIYFSLKNKNWDAPFVEWEEPKNYDEDDEDDYYEEEDDDYYENSNDYYEDEDKERMMLDLYWDRIIQKIYPTPRNIFTVFGRIESIVGNKVIIRMKDENLKKYAINRLPKLAKAFSEDRNQTMSIEFIV
jgi:hypothetical protein